MYIKTNRLWWLLSSSIVSLLTIIELVSSLMIEELNIAWLIMKMPPQSSIRWQILVIIFLLTYLYCMFVEFKARKWIVIVLTLKNSRDRWNNIEATILFLMPGWVVRPNADQIIQRAGLQHYHIPFDSLPFSHIASLL